MSAAVPLPPLPERFHLGDAAAAGVPRHTLRRLVRDGAVRVVSRDVYAAPLTLGDGEPWQLVRQEHLERCRDWLARRPGHVASHQTAAIVHGLDLSVHPAMDVHLTSVERCPRSRRAPGLQLHHADSVRNETAEVDGLRVTTVARTVADVLRSAQPASGVAMLDQAVRAGQVTEAQVRLVLDTQHRWRGRPRALEALALLDPRRESWLESYSFVRLHQLGLPLPRPQVDVLDDGFHLVGRVDGLLGTVFLEADGAGKYLLAAHDRGLTEEESRRQTLDAQRVRHAALERLGLTGVRWTVSEIRHSPELVMARVRQALRSAHGATVTGWVRDGSRVVRPVPHDPLV